MFTVSFSLLITSYWLSNCLIESQPTNSASPCHSFGENWIHHRGNCYKLFTQAESISQIEAEQKCRESHIEVPQLVSTCGSSKKINDELHFLLENIVDNSTEPIWIGTKKSASGIWFDPFELPVKIEDEQLNGLERQSIDHTCLTITPKERVFTFRNCSSAITKSYLCKVAAKRHMIVIHKATVYLETITNNGHGFREWIFHIREQK